MKIATSLVFILALSACAVKDPLEKLGEAHRTFLFGDDESNIAFMGQPASGDKPNCDPRQMKQGYVFKIAEKRVLIESIRPSGTVQHIVKEVVDSPSSITIKAMNGANIPFSMVFDNLTDSSATISQDGESAVEFIRCIK